MKSINVKLTIPLISFWIAMILLWIVLSAVTVDAKEIAVFHYLHKDAAFFSSRMPVISGTYAGTVAITSPVQLGVLDMAFDVGALGDTLTGTVDLARTLVYTSSSGTPVLHGVVTGTDSLTPTFRLSSETFDGFVSGRDVQRSFTLIGEAIESGEILQGTYTEIITGFTPDPMVMEGIFMVTRPPEPQDFSALTSVEVAIGADELWVSGSTVVTVTLLNGYRDLFTPTTPITLSTNRGTISPIGMDVSKGVVTATFDTGAVPGQATIAATTGAITGTASVEVLGYGATVLEWPSLPADLTLPTDGGQTTVTVTVRDQIGQPVSGTVVTFDGILGAVQPPTATTDASGGVTVTFTAGTMPGQAGVVVACDGVTETIPFQLETPEVSGVDLDVGALTLAPGASLPITVTVKDQFGRPMANELVSLFGSLGSVNPSSGLSDSDGRVFAQFTGGSVAGDATITALSGYAHGTITVAITSQNSAPVLDDPGTYTVREGDALSFTVNAHDPDGQALTLSANNVPTGAVFIAQTGVFSWTPGFDAEGSYTVTFEVSDGHLSDAGDAAITVLNTNRAPVAVAGDAQTVNPDEWVQLDGSQSYDPDGNAAIVTYAWTQNGGSSVVLSHSNSVSPTFTAPTTSGVLTFTLTVTDDLGLSAADTTTVTVMGDEQNQPPVADAGSALTVQEGDPVQLDGSGSHDPDGIITAYAWRQTGGTAVTLSSASAVSPTFTAPATSGVLTFTLTVTDDLGLSDADTTTVTVTDEPQAPVADAGPPQTVDTSAPVQLDGSGSRDSDGAIAAYTWRQTDGIIVTLSSASAVSPTFTAPAISGVLTFTLTVADDLGLSNADTTTVNVQDRRHAVYLPLVLRNF
jgi:hypothetical protein